MLDWIGQRKRNDESLCPEARTLVSEVDAKLAAEVIPKNIMDLLDVGMRSSKPAEQIAAAVEIRKRITAQQPVERLRSTVLELRTRYHVATGRTPPAGTPEQDLKSIDKADLAAEADSLLDGLKTVYAVSNTRDQEVDALRYKMLKALAALLGALIIIKLAPVFIVIPPALDQAMNLWVIAIFGGIGALISMMRRSQAALDLGPIDADPVRQISALRHGVSGMLIAGLIGPVLAMVMFGVFAADMLKIVGLTPNIISTDGADAQIHFLGHGYSFAKWTDAAKMAVWAFLAGFAEQLTPDVLDRFSRSAKNADERSS